MKIRQLHINRFGHFNEFDLVFPGDGIQVIYGPNEAGKTTLLEFLRGLLFDFPRNTRYDFGGQGEISGVGTIELKDGRTVELRRRKGIKDKVAIKLNGQPTDLDEAGWLRLLDHADRGLFESVFGFGLDQLSQGETSLKHERLQSALFGGSLGGTSSPDKVIAELSKQAEDLFKKSGSVPAINVRLKEIKTLTKEIKDHLLRPEKYQEAELALKTSTERSQNLHQLVDQLRRDHSKIEKQVRAWPKWWELQQRCSERASLSVPVNIPSDARQRYLALSKELKSLTEKQTKQAQDIRKAELSLAALKLDPGAISFRAEVKSCLELRQSYVEAREQLPERQRQREAIRLLIDRELAELRPGWNHDDLRAFSVDVATRNEIDRLCDERRERATAHTKLTAKRDGDATNLERAREELAEFDSPREVTDLAAVLAEETDFAATRKQLETTNVELAKLERKLATQCMKLMPPFSADISTLSALPVPRAETIADFETRFDEIREQLRTARASEAQDESEKLDIEKMLVASMSNRAIPSLDEREAARGKRDAGWNLVRRKYISPEPVDSAIVAWLDGDAVASLPDSYEQAVRLADDIADQIFDNANEVAQREVQRRKLAALSARLEQKRQRISNLDDQQDELLKKWHELWQPCGLIPLAPDAMLGWLKDHEVACGTIAIRDELSAEKFQLSERLARFEQRLRVATGLAGDDIMTVLVSARRTVEEAKDQSRKTAELQKDIRRLEKQLDKYDVEIDNLATDEKNAQNKWQAVLSRLNLPADWDTDLAREVIEKLNATRVRLDGLPGENERIIAMQARVDEFVKRVYSLCNSLEPELVRSPPELAVKKLDEQVEQALDAQRKHYDLSKKLAEAKLSLESLSDRHNLAAVEFAGLFALASAKTEAEFVEVVAQAEKAVELDGEIVQLNRDIENIRSGDNRDEFERSLSTNDLVVLQGHERDLKEKLKSAETSCKTADEDSGIARNTFLQLNGLRDVALLNEELSRKRSLLASDVDRYMPLVYARHLLNAAVNRFERENQPEMITTVSRLIGQMTGGKYVEFDRTGGSKQTILVRQADGVEKTPEQLSTGTREQLYLAIRLAYVQHYCEQNQPLPIVIDDVLVNFDDRRVRQTLMVLADISKSIQVLFFTCHPHMVEIAREVVPGVSPLSLPVIA